jgi:very-short-patch-repair endonuclease
MAMNGSEQLVSKKAEVWKGRLLDVSNRNPLVRFRKHKASVLTIAMPDASTLFKELDQGRQYTVLSEPKGQEEAGTGRLLVTAQMPEQPVDRVLYNLRSKSRTYRSDHGVNILFVSIGSLLWKEEGCEEFNESPLFLVPVALERQNSFSPYRLQPLDEDTVFNPTLRKRLELDYRLKLPEFDLDNGFVLPAAFEEIQKAIPPSSGWQVNASCHLALFHFSKLLMYSDLDQGIASMASQPVIRALAGDPAALPPEPSGMPRPQEYDTKLRPEDSFQVLDADSSQQEAVQAALAGVSFVLQGPPGTGKSQTITNMIAELMANGKRVLFVSQKMAALDVVKGNLEKCGLGDRCLELHDPKKNRADIVKEIAASLENQNRPRGTAADVRDLAAVRQELNDYARAVHAPRGRLGIDVYRMIGQYASLSEAIDINFKLPAVLEVDEDRLGRMEGMVLRLSQMTAAFRDPAHPWAGALVTEWSDRLQAKVQEELSSLIEARRKLWAAIPALTANLQLPAMESLSDLRRLRQLYRDMADRPAVRREWLEGDLDHLISMTQDGLAAYQDLSMREKGLLGMGSRDILDLDGKLFRHRFEVQYSGALRVLNGGFRRDMKILRAISGRQLTYEEAKFMVRAVDDYQTSLANWKVKRDGLITAHRGAFTGNGEELGPLSDRMSWTRRFRSAHALILNDKVMDDLTSESVPQYIQDGAVDLEMYLGRFDSALNVFASRFSQETRLNGRPLRDAALGDIERWTDQAWASRYRYQEWLDLASLLDGMRALGLDDLVRELRERDVPPEGMVKAFQRRFRRLWTEEALASDPVLSRFRRDHQMGLIDRFNELDRLHVERGRLRVQARVEENLRKKREGADRNVLLKQETEIARLAKLKRQRKAVRAMLDECWDLIGLLKPCMLMSPLSVAQFLDRERTRFDTVIFDEASQICPEDAIGSIARGQQVIVVGDSKQMPPTSFFALSSEDEDEEPDLESILDECETCGMSRRMLTWHYRSKDESLIAFSNHQFYGGKLNTFPSPIFGREGFGLHHVLVPNGVFDRGRTRTNRAEAEAVARMVRDHYAKRDGRSLGVIAFSEAQQEAIDQALNEMRREDRELDAVLSSEEGEPFLLYNLENVQGHERDRIILSVGYGRDENGRFALNLGPLNRDGGERRLNVAITRAKLSLDIVSSIRSEDIDLSGSRSKGALLLKQYLAFAESGGDRRALPSQSARQEEAAPFEEHICKALQARGHKVRMNVGTSDYRVDLAIEDPAEEGKFLLGIECDGPHYVSGLTVRDRDRTRQAQLRRLGWKLHRVWSVEWFRNPEGELDRIEEALRSANTTG